MMKGLQSILVQIGSRTMTTGQQELQTLLKDDNLRPGTTSLDRESSVHAEN